MKTTCVVIDDEIQARQQVLACITKYLPDMIVLGEAENLEKAVKLIHEAHPDLIFLDVEIKDKTGFDVLYNFPEPWFQVIFVTAHSDHAIRAFQVSAIDYLLKPIDEKLFLKAVEKATEKINKQNALESLYTLLNNHRVSEKSKSRIILNTSENVHIVEISQIIHCEANVNYTIFYLTSKEKIIVSRTLKEFEEMLNDLGFFRSHQSHLVNLMHVKRFEKKDGGYLLMSDNTTVPVSFRKKEQLMEILASFS